MTKTLFRATALAAMALSLASCGILRGRRGPTTPTVGTRVPILASAASLAVDPNTAQLQVLLPEPVANADWDQPGGGASKALGHVALGTNLTQAWSVSIPGGSNRARLASAPVVHGGKLFAIDTAGTVHAFDAATGAALWTVHVGDTSRDGERSQFGGGVSVDDSGVYATTGFGDVAALDPTTGAVRWTVHPGGPLRGSPTLFLGLIIVMSQDNQMFALRSADGNVEWQQAGSITPGSMFGAGAPAAGQGTVVAGYSSGELNAYRYENGRPLWADALARTSISVAVSTLSDVDANPVIDRGRVFAIGEGGRMAAYELNTGQRTWELSIAGISTPWVAGEWVFVVTDDAKLYCIARATGRVRWIAELPHWRDAEDRKGPIRWTGPILAGGRLILTSSDGRMAQVSPADGSVQSMTETSGPSRLPPVVAGGTLYLLDDAGQLTAWR